MFKPTYLYIKTHNVTGLKYFGKTTKDPFKYSGSGVYWCRHIKEHGNNVTTEIYGFYTNETKCKDAALQFSQDNNIETDSNWANLKPENGLDGGLSSTIANKIKDVIIKKYGKEYFAKIARESRLGKKLSEETKLKIKANAQGGAGKKGRDSPSYGLIRNKVQCPHCGKEGAQNTMSRWHFNNCRNIL